MINPRVAFLESQNKHLLDEIRERDEKEIKRAGEDCPTLIRGVPDDFEPQGGTVTLAVREVENYKYRYGRLVDSLKYKLERKDMERRWVEKLKKELDMYFDMIFDR